MGGCDMKVSVRSKLRDLAVYLTISLLFFYGMDNVHTLGGKLLILLAPVPGIIYEYLFVDNSEAHSEYMRMYRKFRGLISGR